MQKIAAALISVYYKDGLEPIVRNLHELGVTIYSTGGTQKFITELGIPTTGVEDITGYPSILGGRVKTLHPSVFGGILRRTNEATDLQEMKEHNIPSIDLVIVDLYPFEETLAATKDEKQVIEKIDIGGPSMLRAAAKNFNDVLVIAAKEDYPALENLLVEQQGSTTIEQRKAFAAKAFRIVMEYDIAISNYFNSSNIISKQTPLRYGENPHQSAFFEGDASEIFTQLHGKELSYNNITDVDAALQLIHEFPRHNGLYNNAVFAIIKHTNVCGISIRSCINEAWENALEGDPESAFGGVLVCNGAIDKPTAQAISEMFFEVLLAYDFDEEALSILQKKKNRILLKIQNLIHQREHLKSVLNGVLRQQSDTINYSTWSEVGGLQTTSTEKEDLGFANIICKHLKSNAIAIVKNYQLIGKGCGQTSRIDALLQAIEKAKQSGFDLKNAVLASDAFFPFNDCVKMAHDAGITAFIQPGGSIRDKDSIDYCVANNLAMVLTGTRHFRH